jgi:Golgi phosphoprotein 3
MLILPEELFLLAINDAKGRIHGPAAPMLRYGLVGAVLADLALRRNVRLDHKGRLETLGEGPRGDDILEEAFARIQAADRLHKASHWINLLSDDSSKLQQRLAERLVIKGVLRLEKKRLLWVVPYTLYPQQDASAKYWIKQQLRSAVLTNEPSEPRAVALLNLLSACELLGLVFTADEHKAAQRRIVELSVGDAIATAVVETIEAIETSTLMVVNASLSEI